MKATGTGTGTGTGGAQCRPVTVEGGCPDTPLSVAPCSWRMTQDPLAVTLTHYDVTHHVTVSAGHTFILLSPGNPGRCQHLCVGTWRAHMKSLSGRMSP